MTKYIVGLLLALLSSIAIASPETEEKRAFCAWSATNAEAAAEARQVLQMTDEEFTTRVLIFYNQLLMSGMPEMMVMQTMSDIVDGWNSPWGPEITKQKVYETCMGRSSV